MFRTDQTFIHEHYGNWQKCDDYLHNYIVNINKLNQRTNEVTLSLNQHSPKTKAVTRELERRIEKRWFGTKFSPVRLERTHFVHLIHISAWWSKKMIDVNVWWRLFWHLACIRVSLLQTDACNIISHSIFTSISLQPPHYSIQSGGWGRGVVFHNDPRHLDGVLQRYSLNNNVNKYIYDVPLRRTWFCSGPLGRIAT